jgi:hypothetical protein
MLKHRRKRLDGVMVGRECFVDMTQGKVFEPEDGWNTKDLPYATGETSSQHQSDAFRENFELIEWNRARLEVPADMPPATEARRKFAANYDAIRWD